MRPSADVGQSAGERRAGGFIFPDSEDSRPSPNIPRDGNPRSVRNEQSEQQRILIDWDAASGLHDSDEFAYSAYLDLTSSGARSLEQNRGFYENLINSTYFRSGDLRPTEREINTEFTDEGVRVEGRTPAEDRLPRENLISIEICRNIAKSCAQFTEIIAKFVEIIHFQR